MKKVRKIAKISFWVILVIVAIYSTYSIVAKIIWKNDAPSFLGYKNFIVLTGSMKPKLNEGDIVFVRKKNKIEENDIISFKVNNSIVTHRVIDIKYMDDKKIYITKGDANSGIDNELVEDGDIEGVYSFKIPFVGRLILFLRTPTGLIMLLVVLGILLFINAIRPEKKKVAS